MRIECYIRPNESLVSIFDWSEIVRASITAGPPKVDRDLSLANFGPDKNVWTPDWKD
jgi:hypothetical protein